MIWLAGCALRPSPGQLQKLEPSTSFVHASGTLWIQGPDGVRSLQLDGSQGRTLFPRGLSVLDVSGDGSRVLLLQDSKLVLADGARQAALPEGDAASAAALSPEGSTLAVLGPHGDTVDMVDIPSGQVRTLPGEHPDFSARIAFSQDGTKLWLQGAGRGEVVPIDGGARHFEENPPFPLRVPLPLSPRPVCPASGAELRTGDDGVELVQPNQPPRKLATLEGKRRGLSDTLPAFDAAFFSPDCSAAVLLLNGSVDVVDLASGRVGHLADGDAAFFGPDRSP